MEEILRPRHLFLYHLPFGRTSPTATGRPPDVPAVFELPDVRLLSEPLQRESL